MLRMSPKQTAVVAHPNGIESYMAFANSGLDSLDEAVEARMVAVKKYANKAE